LSESYACVASFHVNPYTCGVARFNSSLARSLRTTVSTLDDALKIRQARVLLSIKLQEIDESGLATLATILERQDLGFDLFLHACDFSELENRLLEKSGRVFAASSEIGDQVKQRRSDVVSLYAPGAAISTVREASEINLLTFGMAHKISANGYRKLGKILSSGRRTFQLDVSSALHEGTNFDENFFLVGAEISEVFGGNVVFLGFLADDEVSRRLQSATALVAFFPSGVRENNTTVMSAMAHGCAVISNLDASSPKWMEHGKTIFDIGRLDEFPSPAQVAEVGRNARAVVAEFNFENLAKSILAK